MDPDFTLTSRTRLINEIIGSEMQAELATNDIILYPPEVSEAYNRNTRIPVKVYKTAVLVNSFVAYITRLSLNDVLSPLNIPKEILLGLTTTHEVLPLIRDQYGIYLTTEDIVLELLADNDNTITAAAGSFGFIGTYDFNKPIILRTLNEYLYQVDGLYLAITPGSISV